jgi:hypothetical protein
MDTSAVPASGLSRPFARVAARLGVASAAIAILALAALHLLQPELDPAASMISQYAIGPHGWLMNLSFAGFASGSFFLLLALAGQPKSMLRWLGLVCLLLAGIGLTFGALFNMDPATDDPSRMSFAGRMHGLAFMIGVPGELLTVLLLSIAFFRAPWNGKALAALAVVVWISLIAMAVNLIGWMQAGATGPAYFGIPNRTFMLGYALWLIAVAWPIARPAPR